MSDVQLLHGDCLKLLPTLDAGSVDAVVTDPPYFLPATHYCTRKEFPRSLADLSMLEHFYRDVFGKVVRVLKPTGCLYVFCDGQSYPAFFCTLYRHVKRIQPLVWDKMTSFNGYSWRHQHELILWAEMHKAPVVKTGDGDILRHRAVKVDSREHPAEKPPELLARLIGKSVPEDGTVLDPFMGSGTAGLAALKLGCKFIGIERDANYYDIACRRIEAARAETAVAA